jgi:ATP synthase protein I
MDDDEQNPKRMQMIASYLTLPFAMAVPPIVGYYIGTWLDDYFRVEPYAMYTLLLLGFVAGSLEFYRIVTKYKDNEM